MTPSEKMPAVEREKFIIEQTCVLLAAGIAKKPNDVSLDDYIKKHFKEVYAVLANEVKQPYITSLVKW